MPQMARKGNNQYGPPKENIICVVCGNSMRVNNFSLVDKRDASKGYRNTCKKCSKNKRETEIRNRDWKYRANEIMYMNAKARAKKNNIVFTITKEDIIIPEYCPVLGIKLFREGKDTWMNAPSIDRIDNNKGYTKDNIMVISRRANILKKDATFDELITIGKFYERLLSGQKH